MNVVRQAARAVRREFLAGDLLTVFAALEVSARVTRSTSVPTAVITATPNTSAANTVSRSPARNSRRTARAAWRTTFMRPDRSVRAGGRCRCGRCDGSAAPNS
ncbi:hypothetical protein BXO2_20205, partial [Xanthomonas oryzae pv. oryzae]